jgi:restriction endonuclease S subunit
MISVIDIKMTGIGYYSVRHIVESHYKRIATAQPNYGDVLIVRSGEGSIGKSAIFLGKPEGKKIGITGHINTLGFKEINSFYVEVYLKTIFGQSQIERFESGVSGQTEFTQDSISEIRIPVLPSKVQDNIEVEYKKVSAFHDKAMTAKKNNDEVGYKLNIELAEKILKDLVSKTEAVIRGERNNVID